MGFEILRDVDNGTSPQVAEKTSRWGSPIGLPLEEVRQRLRIIADRLHDTLDDHAMPMLVESKRLLQERTCRIAVIGQIKAGKSTFINALTQHPSLLPTDINPWTAVVTMLHFLNDTPYPEHAAVFHFFAPDEWRNLAEGGGRLRELTERLIPEFQSDLLKAQLEVMRQRAEKRLGQKFHELLGQTHTYQEMTQDILSDYISAGDNDESREMGPRRLYSDITRTAELYFSRGPFAFPVTVIDTPGTNDPFLIRDEITRRALENPDIYVFVISAIQPLSGSDLSMLRLLNGLHKDRIVVFINRTDQLNEPLKEAPALRASVEKRLKQEFPSLDIPVVLGSAWWAHLSLQSDSLDPGAFLHAPAQPYLRAFGLPDSIDITRKSLSPREKGEIAKALYAGSGLSTMSTTITKLMRTGASAILLQQIATCFLEFTKASEMSARMESSMVLDLIETSRSETGAAETHIEREREQIAATAGRAHQLRQCFDQVEGQLKDIVAQNTERMRLDLQLVVETFANEACREMIDAVQYGKRTRVWRCDVMPLRELLEREYVESFRQIARDLSEIEKALHPQLRALVETLLPNHGMEYVEDSVPQQEPYPSIAPLNEIVVLDLEVSWWQYWFAARPDPHARLENLITLIKQDFFPMVEELVRESRAQLANRIARSLHSGMLIGDTVMQTIENRNTELHAHLETLKSPVTQQSREQFETEQRNQLARCSERRSLSSALSAELGLLLKSLQAGLNPEGQKS